jgi:hypothetical protein
MILVAAAGKDSPHRSLQTTENSNEYAHLYNQQDKSRARLLFWDVFRTTSQII